MKFITGMVKGASRLVNLPEKVDKLEDKVDKYIASAVTQEQLTNEFEMHREATTEKLDLVIHLLKKNGG